MKNYYLIFLNRLCKWKREIKTVGFSDWWWFVVVLKRNEFHPSLNLGMYVLKSMKIGDREFKDRMYTLTKLRDRAHRIDAELEKVKI